MEPHRPRALAVEGRQAGHVGTTGRRSVREHQRCVTGGRVEVADPAGLAGEDGGLQAEVQHVARAQRGRRRPRATPAFKFLLDESLRALQATDLDPLRHTLRVRADRLPHVQDGLQLALGRLAAHRIRRLPKRSDGRAEADDDVATAAVGQRVHLELEAEPLDDLVVAVHEVQVVAQLHKVVGAAVQKRPFVGLRVDP